MKNKLILSSFALLLAVSGCGRLRTGGAMHMPRFSGKGHGAAPQPSGHVELPPFTADPTRPFALTDAGSEVTFDTGSLVFWDAKATPEAIRAVADASVQGRLLKSMALTFLDGEPTNDKQALLDATDRLRAATDARDHAAEANKGNIDKVRDAQMPIANAWFDNRLDELRQGNKISDSDKAHAQGMWQAYCEAKLWEMATSVELKLAYKTRPTPLQLCENYYTAQGYFQDQGRCGPASDAAGKDYFSCLWQDGVLKSKLFADAYRKVACTAGDAHAPTAEGAITQWLQSGILKTALQDPDATSDKIHALSTVIFTGDLINRTFAKKWNLSNCRNAFSRTSPAAGSPDAGKWWLDFPNKLIAIGEVDTPQNLTYSLLPQAADDATNRANYDKLVKDIRLFAIHNGAHQEQPSYSSYTFNITAAGRQALDDKVIDAVQADPVFAKLQDLTDSLTPQELKDAVNKAQDDVARTHADLVETGAGFPAAIGMPLANNRSAAFAAVTAPNTTLYLASFPITVKKTDTQLLVKALIGDANHGAQPLLGCINLVDGSTCQALPAELGSGQWIDLAFTPEQGKITLKFALNTPEIFGFGPVPEAQINTLPEDQLNGRTVVIEAYANRLNDNLDFFTGSATIQDALGKVLFSGSVSGDNFYQQEAAKLKALGLHEDGTEVAATAAH